MHSMLVAPGDRGGERGRGHFEFGGGKKGLQAFLPEGLHALRMSWFSVLVADRSTGLSQGFH